MKTIDFIGLLDVALNVANFASTATWHDVLVALAIILLITQVR